MSETREFPVGAILTVTSGKMVHPFDEVHELLDHLTGDTLFTHQLPRAAEECEPHLRTQHPDLAAVEVPDGLDSWEKCKAFVSDVIASCGGDTLRPVTPIPSEDHTSIDPISELKMMRPDMPIFPIVVDE
jgi:hypothetical protein